MGRMDCIFSNTVLAAEMAVLPYLSRQNPVLSSSAFSSIGRIKFVWCHRSPSPKGEGRGGAFWQRRWLCFHTFPAKTRPRPILQCIWWRKTIDSLVSMQRWQPTRSWGFGGTSCLEFAWWPPKRGDGKLYFNHRIETRGYYFGHPYGIYGKLGKG